MSDSTSDGAADGRPLAFPKQTAAGTTTPNKAPEASAVAPRTCLCGHDRSHYLVSPVPTYTGWAKFWVIFMGVSTKPSRVDFQCRQCGQTFDCTLDSKELGAFL